MRRHRNAARGSPFGLGTSSAVFLGLLLGFVDLTTNTQMLGLAAAAISTPFVNPPPKNNGDKKLNVTPTPFYIRIRWKDGAPHDIDTWVRCYNLVEGTRGNEITIGYSRKSHGWLDLLRDDLGGPSYLNEESVQSNSTIPRMLPNTTCRINLHLYHSHGGKLPVVGNVVVIQDKDSDDETLVGDVEFQLDFPGQEITTIVATWDDHGNLIQEAVEKFPEAPVELIATKEE